jgi:hypothetical protein
MTRYDALFSKKDEWVSLGDLCDENNLFKRDFESLLRAFSLDNGLILVYLFPYGVLSGLVDREAKDDILILTPTLPIEKIPQYLNEDGYIVYPITNNQLVYEDYSKKKKRNDFIYRIFISKKNRDVHYCDISPLDQKLIRGFNIQCNIEHKGENKRNIDLFEYWDKFEDDDRITIVSDLVPRIFSDEV